MKRAALATCGVLVVAAALTWALRDEGPRVPKTVRAGPAASAPPSASSDSTEAGAGESESALEGAAHSILYDVLANDMGEDDVPFLREQLVEAMALDRLGTVASRVRVARDSLDRLMKRVADEPKLEGDLTPLQERAIAQEAKRWHRSIVAALAPDEAPADRTFDGYQRASWRILTGFDFEPGMTLPAGVRALDGARVAVDGYMIITAYSDATRERRVEEFLLTESMWGCCFARTPQIHEGIVVDAPRVEGHEGPITVLGVLEVQERREDGEVTGIYRLKAHRVSPLE